MGVGDYEDWYKVDEIHVSLGIQNALGCCGDGEVRGKSGGPSVVAHPPQTIPFLGYHQQILNLALITHMLVPKPVGFDSSNAMTETEHVRMIIIAIP